MSAQYVPVQYVQKEIQEMILISTLITIRVKQSFLVYMYFKFLTVSGASCNNNTAHITQI